MASLPMLPAPKAAVGDARSTRSRMEGRIRLVMGVREAILMSGSTLGEAINMIKKH